jgi:hypothetical protein
MFDVMIINMEGKPNETTTTMAKNNRKRRANDLEAEVGPPLCDDNTYCHVSKLVNFTSWPNLSTPKRVSQNQHAMTHGAQRVSACSEKMEKGGICSNKVMLLMMQMMIIVLTFDVWDLCC